MQVFNIYNNFLRYDGQEKAFCTQDGKCLEGKVWIFALCGKIVPVVFVFQPVAELCQYPLIS